MTTTIIGLILILVGALHLYPVIGVLSATRLHGLYGTEITDSKWLILMRHRSLLLGLLGAFLIYAAFTPQLRWLAYLSGSISLAGFILLGWLAEAYQVAIRRVLIADWIALIGLVIAMIMHYIEHQARI